MFKRLIKLFAPSPPKIIHDKIFGEVALSKHGWTAKYMFNGILSSIELSGESLDGPTQEEKNLIFEIENKTMTLIKEVESTLDDYAKDINMSVDKQSFKLNSIHVDLNNIEEPFFTLYFKLNITSINKEIDYYGDFINWNLEEAFEVH